MISVLKHGKSMWVNVNGYIVLASKQLQKKVARSHHHAEFPNGMSLIFFLGIAL